MVTRAIWTGEEKEKLRAAIGTRGQPSMKECARISADVFGGTRTRDSIHIAYQRMFMSRYPSISAAPTRLSTPKDRRGCTWSRGENRALARIRNQYPAETSAYLSHVFHGMLGRSALGVAARLESSHPVTRALSPSPEDMSEAGAATESRVIDALALAARVSYIEDADPDDPELEPLRAAADDMERAREEREDPNYQEDDEDADEIDEAEYMGTYRCDMAEEAAEARADAIGDRLEQTFGAEPEGYFRVVVDEGSLFPPCSPDILQPAARVIESENEQSEDPEDEMSLQRAEKEKDALIASFEIAARVDARIAAIAAHVDARVDNLEKEIKKLRGDYGKLAKKSNELTDGTLSDKIMRVVRDMPKEDYGNIVLEGLGLVQEAAVVGAPRIHALNVPRRLFSVPGRNE